MKGPQTIMSLNLVINNTNPSSYSYFFIITNVVSKSSVSILLCVSDFGSSVPPDPKDFRTSPPLTPPLGRSPSTRTVILETGSGWVRPSLGVFGTSTLVSDVGESKVKGVDVSLLPLLQSLYLPHTACVSYDIHRPNVRCNRQQHTLTSGFKRDYTTIGFRSEKVRDRFSLGYVNE